MAEPITEPVRWTTDDLDLLPDNGLRYEIVEGALFMTRAPDVRHQDVCGNFYFVLKEWSLSNNVGRPIFGPGVIFDKDNAVIPDVVWMSNERLATLMDEAGHLTGAPEIVIEVLSAGTENERRDRELKRKLYTLRGVQEYWVADWRLRQLEVYRRERGQLRLQATLLAADELTSPLLPDFACSVERFFT